MLPALPDAWPTGFVKGLRARGGFEVSINWDKGEIVEAEIYSHSGGLCSVQIDALVKSEFQTVIGKRYMLSLNPLTVQEH
ncbi:glycoside hydrolase family 95-like protein [Paenibacillus alginolyticus]|uniref:glycoside hydrolase family 95-like protein n=1 Tax=Paenibacillus alginolyticus TaxID=59839 RepID=UPI0035E43008